MLDLHDSNPLSEGNLEDINSKMLTLIASSIILDICCEVCGTEFQGYGELMKHRTNKHEVSMKDDKQQDLSSNKIYQGK